MKRRVKISTERIEPELTFGGWDILKTIPEFIQKYGAERIERFERARRLEDQGFGILQEKNKRPRVVIPSNDPTELNEDTLEFFQVNYCIVDERQLNYRLRKAQQEPRITHYTRALKLASQYLATIRDLQEGI